MVIDPNGNGESFVSHRAEIKSISPDKKTVSVKTEEGLTFEEPIESILKLNHPHKFSEDIVGNLILEDGLTCDYNSVNIKLVMLKILIKIESIVESIDFKADSLEEITKK